MLGGESFLSSERDKSIDKCTGRLERCSGGGVGGGGGWCGWCHLIFLSL